MDRNRFNSEVCPYLVEIRIGEQGIAFDRLDLDAWVDQYKARNGRPASNLRGKASWDAKEVRGLGIAVGSWHIEKQLDLYIGSLPLGNVHMGTLQSFIEARRKQGIKSKSINYKQGL